MFGVLVIFYQVPWMLSLIFYQNIYYLLGSFLLYNFSKSLKEAVHDPVYGYSQQYQHNLGHSDYFVVGNVVYMIVSIIATIYSM